MFSFTFQFLRQSFYGFTDTDPGKFLEEGLYLSGAFL